MDVDVDVGVTRGCGIVRGADFQRLCQEADLGLILVEGCLLFIFPLLQPFEVSDDLLFLKRVLGLLCSSATTHHRVSNRIWFLRSPLQRSAARKADDHSLILSALQEIKTPKLTRLLRCILS